MANRLRDDLRWSSREGASCCVMLGAGESSFSPFLLAAGHSAVSSGFVTTLPLFFGALLQNFSPWALGRLGSVRTWSSGMASLQGLCLIALSAGALFGTLSLGMIFALVSLYWAAGWSVGPAWNTWMDSVIPARLRGRFFARRNAVCMLVQWTTLMAASALLLWSQKHGLALQAFCALFGLAGAARLYSAFCMARQSQPVPLPPDYRVLGFAESLGRVRGNPKARPLVYMLGAQFSMTLAAPFFVPYLSQVKGVGYAGLMMCLAAAIFSRALLLSRLGQVARQVRPRRLFAYSGCGLAVIPLLWLVPGIGLPGFLALQILAGGFLAAYEMAVTLVYLEAVPVGDRTSVLTRFGVLNTFAMLLGSGLGGACLMLGGNSALAYHALFVLAAVMRLATLGLLVTPSASISAEAGFQGRARHHLVAPYLHGRPARIACKEAEPSVSRP